MNTASIKIVRLCISYLVFFSTVHVRAWDVDFSRRQLEFTEVKSVDQLQEPVESKGSVFETLFEPTGTTQDVVVMNTESGFVPDTVSLKKNHLYKIHVVNVNEKNKNISFKLDAFSENHNTVFGKPKTFQINPKQEGVFSFHCPETEVSGKFVVIGNDRKLAADK